MKDEQQRQIFRKEALERLSSPEKLDQLMQIISPQDWLPLTTVAILLFLGLVWSIFAKIPVTVIGQGVLLYPGKIIPLQSPISGQLKSLKVTEGQCIAKNQVLGIIDPVELREKLQLQQQKLAQSQQQIQQLNLVVKQRLEVEQDAIASQQLSLQQKLADIQALNPNLRSNKLNYLQQQRQNLEKRLLDAQQLAPFLEARLKKREELLQQGALSEDNVLRARQEYLEANQQIAEIEAELKELEVKKTEIEQTFLDNTHQIKQINDQIAELTTRKQRLAQENLELGITNKTQIEDLKREIKQTEQQITLQSQIRSPQAGCLLEITTNIGQVMTTGSILGKLNLEQNQAAMTAILYFPIKDGKRIQSGMSVKIAPDNIEKERFGSIMGIVTNVSAFPVTKEGANLVLGNSQLVESLIPEGQPKIEVKTHLELNSETVSGYQWSSSQGPPLRLTNGTTVTAKVQVEARSPISFVIKH